jgi:PIN domain nuclease of toxin-antitoxin system
MSRVVLDASAVLAGFFREPGAELVAERGATAILSAVNYSEILVKLTDRGVKLHDADRYIASLGLTAVVFDHEHALTAASFRPQTRSLGLSFADRACLACGYLQSLPVLTADRDLAKALVGVEIVLIR